MTNRKPVRDRLGALGWRRGSPSGRLQPATARHSANAGSHCAAGLTLVFRHKTVHRATVKPTHAAGDRTGDRVKMAKSSKRAPAGRVRVAPNVYRQVTPAGVASWVLRFQLRGVKRWMGLGPVGTYSQKEALQRARAAHQQIFDGVDPISARQEQRASALRKAILTISFEAAASQFHDQHAPKWSHKSRTAFT